MGDSNKGAMVSKNGKQVGFAVGHTFSTGRPKMSPEVRKILEAATPDAAKLLVEQLKATSPHGLLGELFPDNNARRKAAEAIFDRLLGRPTQAIFDETSLGSQGIDMSLFSTEEIRMLQALRKKVWSAQLVAQANAARETDDESPGDDEK